MVKKPVLVVLLIAVFLALPLNLFSAARRVKTAEVISGSAVSSASIMPFGYVIRCNTYEDIFFTGSRVESPEKSRLVSRYKKARIVDLTGDVDDYLNLTMYYNLYGGDLLVLVEVANDTLDSAGMTFARIDLKTCRVKWRVCLPSFEMDFPDIKKGTAYFNGGHVAGTVDLATGKWEKNGK